VTLGGRLLGAMAFGPAIDTRKTLTLVEGTSWDGYLELNRLAFSDELPRNSESRAIAYALREIARRYPHVQWVVSYSDATQCGDGTIYRAAGFWLTSIRKNSTLWRAPDGAVVSNVGVASSPQLQNRYAIDGTRRSMRAAGFEPLAGYQLRYIKPLHDGVRERLTVPIIPYDQIPDEVRMYRGQRPSARA
jgi:hypothetical protein